ncbi:MAG: hypothetical protein U0271_30335 [Polyangiaceae bacterium]
MAHDHGWRAALVSLVFGALAASCEGSVDVQDCPVGQTLCDGACFDLTADANHCGDCNTRCEDGCVDSACVDDGCDAGFDPCGADCVDFDSDRAHCGDCDTNCGTSPCVAGECVTKCTGGLTECNGACVDTTSDALNCGDCFAQCGPGGACIDSSCSGACDGICGACEVLDLPSETTTSVSGSTAGLPNAHTPACANTMGSDVLYVFKVPTSGTYRFSTDGSSYDTILDVLAESCMSIGCNDDKMGPTSQVDVGLVSGQTIYVVVDGFGSGSYTLSVTLLQGG